MAKIELTPEDLQVLSECINEQKDVPAELLTKLSPGFFEKLSAEGRFDFKALDKFKIPTIEYDGKRPESVILAQAAITGGAAPLQVVRSFANGKNGDWKNLIVQGDNLQFLKTCYMNQDPLIKDKVKGMVKLIYIDPPFATQSDFQSSDGVDSYSDKIDRAEFLEALRERLIYMRELLAVDGNIFVHLDQKMSHYVRALLDEVFKNHFQNEIIWQSTASHNDAVKKYGQIHQTILWYFNENHPQYYFDKVREGISVANLKEYSKLELEDGAVVPYKGNEGLKGRRFRTVDATWKGSSKNFVWRGCRPRTNREWMYDFEGMENALKKGGLYLSDPKKGAIRCKKMYFDQNKGLLVQDIWTSCGRMVGGAGNNYPTEKPEVLLERIVLSTTENDALVADLFGGSGTTAAVAEKLGRRWIVCDFGKHAIYTMQKRILNVADSKKLGNGGKNEKYGQPPKPFCIVSAGAYDFSRIMDLRKNQDAYITFVLGLFNIVREKADFSKKYKLPNIYAEKSGNPVEVFSIWDDEYLKNIRIDEEYLQGIIDASGGKLKGDYYIITPETCARVGDTTLKNVGKEKVNFKLLKFPYKVLEELSRHFQIEEQAASSADINRLISSMGFYFNEDVKIEAERRNGGFKIAQFITGILNKGGQRFKELDGLAMILVDLDYDGSVFDMDAAVYNKDIGEDGVVKIDGLTKNSHIIAIDKHGNESKVTKIK
jgi:DNA modification methylase